MSLNPLLMFFWWPSCCIIRAQMLDIRGPRRRTSTDEPKSHTHKFLSWSLKTHGEVVEAELLCGFSVQQLETIQQAEMNLPGLLTCVWQCLTPHQKPSVPLICLGSSPHVSHITTNTYINEYACMCVRLFVCACAFVHDRKCMCVYMSVHDCMCVCLYRRVWLYVSLTCTTHSVFMMK